jgi:hypothetical protein
MAETLGQEVVDLLGGAQAQGTFFQILHGVLQALEQVLEPCLILLKIQHQQTVKIVEK